MPELHPPLPTLAGVDLAEIARMTAERRLPPVDRWDPPHCGASRMHIARDGTWYHDGTSIDRPAMVRLFASLLRREEDGGYVLVTPVEKLSIAVEDLPFVAVEVASEGADSARTLVFRLNTDEAVVAGPEHRLRLSGACSALRVRGGLEARIARSVYYELVDLALTADPPGFWSNGTFFSLDGA